MSPGVEIAPPSMFAHTSQGDYDQLCRLDVWGLADCPENDQNDVYREFKEQLQRPELWSSTVSRSNLQPSMPSEMQVAKV